jgi:hypothetical protein
MNDETIHDEVARDLADAGWKEGDPWPPPEMRPDYEAPSARDANPLGVSRNEEIGRAAEDIRDWWMKCAEGDSVELARKAIKYGAADLKVMGVAMAELFPGKDGLTAQELQAVGLEMALAFYALGKAARLFGEYQQGRVPDGDHWHDMQAYAGMARFVRDHGRWMP